MKSENYTGMISLMAVCSLIQANDVIFFWAIFISQKEGEKKNLYSLDNIIVGSKGTQEVCPICPGRGQQDGSAAAAVFPAWEPRVAEGSIRTARHLLC